MPEKIKKPFTLNEIESYLPSLSSLRSFNKVAFNISKCIQRNVMIFEKELKDKKEIVEELTKRLKEEVVFVEGVPSDRDKYKDFKETIKSIQEEKIELEIYVFSTKDFPDKNTDFGEKEVPLQNGTVMKISYLEEYLKLLDELVIEEEDFDDYVVKWTQREVTSKLNVERNE